MPAKHYLCEPYYIIITPNLRPSIYKYVYNEPIHQLMGIVMILSTVYYFEMEQQQQESS